MTAHALITALYALPCSTGFNRVGSGVGNVHAGASTPHTRPGMQTAVPRPTRHSFRKREPRGIRGSRPRVCAKVNRKGK